MNEKEFALACINTVAKQTMKGYTAPSGTPHEFLFMDLRQNITYVGRYEEVLSANTLLTISNRAMELGQLEHYGGADRGAVFIPPQDIPSDMCLYDVTIFKVIVVDGAFQIVEVLEP